MENFITKSKYFNENFNTAIFSDPIRIYFAEEHESQALEMYTHLQQRREECESFIRQKGDGQYCYFMIYSSAEDYKKHFASGESAHPVEFGNDFVFALPGPPESEAGLQSFLKQVDQSFSATA